MLHGVAKHWIRLLAPEGEGAADPANPGGGNGTAAPAPAGTGVPAPAVPGAPRPGRGAKVITIQRATLAKQVKEAGERARLEERAALEKRAKQLGYKSLDEMLRGGRPAVRAPAPTPAGVGRTAQPPAHGAGDAESKRYQRQVEQYQRNLAAEKRARIAAQRLRREAELDRDALEAERALERIALDAGIRDTDYAIHLYAKHCEGRSPEELAKLDEAVFFSGLKATKPFIFGERPVTEAPATTTTPGGAAPPAPTPKAAVVQGAGDKFDARRATAEEVRARAAKIGVRMPGG